MKNIHILPTDQPSRLAIQLDCKPKYNLQLSKIKNNWTDNWEKQYIYITSDEEIKKGDWCLGMDGIFQYKGKVNIPDVELPKKVILTTDSTLIADGIQSIDDKFLEWFIKNPTCEFANLDSICKCIACGSSVKSSCDYAYKCKPQIFYKITIPQEHKYSKVSSENDTQMFFDEEAAEKFYPPRTTDLICSPKLVRDAFVAGAHYQAERLYSEEEVFQMLLNYQSNYTYANNEKGLRYWFNQNKKK